MEKESHINYNHSISLTERKNLMISGVKKIDNFDNEQFLMDTVMGFLLVKGEGLELVKLDTLQGSVIIKGYVNSMTYLEDGLKKNKENTIFNRLFK